MASGGTNQQILNGAKQLISERECHGWTISEIVRAACLAEWEVCHHFENFEDPLREMTRSHMIESLGMFLSDIQLDSRILVTEAAAFSQEDGAQVDEVATEDEKGGTLRPSTGDSVFRNFFLVDSATYLFGGSSLISRPRLTRWRKLIGWSICYQGP